jgi:hypothetical protein
MAMTDEDKDGELIGNEELWPDEVWDPIAAVREEATFLPRTYRRGRGGDSDLASTEDGGRHGVSKPKNPEDDYK